MKRLLMLCAVLVSCVAVADVQILPSSRFYAQYQMVSNSPLFNKMHDRLQESAPGALNDLIFKECGVVNAYFEPGTRNIVMCFEFMKYAEDLAKGFGPQSREYFSYTLQFVVLHEFGHAVIQGASVPVLGRGEDAADQIASVIMKRSGQYGRFLSAVGSTMMKKRISDIFVSKAEAADEHSMNPQRMANMICWAGGNDVAFLSDAIRAGRLTQQRAERCADEATQADNAVSAMLKTPWLEGRSGQ